MRISVTKFSYQFNSSCENAIVRLCVGLIVLLLIMHEYKKVHSLNKERNLEKMRKLDRILYEHDEMTL